MPPASTMRPLRYTKSPPSVGFGSTAVMVHSSRRGLPGANRLAAPEAEFHAKRHGAACEMGGDHAHEQGAVLGAAGDQAAEAGAAGISRVVVQRVVVAGEGCERADAVGIEGDLPREAFTELVGCHGGDPAADAPHPGQGSDRHRRPAGRGGASGRRDGGDRRWCRQRHGGDRPVPGRRRAWWRGRRRSARRGRPSARGRRVQ